MRVRDHQDELKPIIGTLAHNRTFTHRDLSEYLAYHSDSVLSGHSAQIIRWLREKKLIQTAHHPGRGRRLNYYPTVIGWNWIDSDKTEGEQNETVDQRTA